MFIATCNQVFTHENRCLMFAASIRKVTFACFMRMGTTSALLIPVYAAQCLACSDHSIMMNVFSDDHISAYLLIDQMNKELSGGPSLREE